MAHGSVTIKNVQTNGVSVGELTVDISYDLAELKALIEAYPELIKAALTLMKGVNDAS